MKKLALLFCLLWFARAAEPRADEVTKARADLEAMLKTDQAQRLGVMTLEKEKGRNAPEIAELWRKQKMADDHNIRRLEEIIAAHGWPKRSVFGAEAANAAFLILQHADISFQKKYVALCRDAVAAKEMSGSSLALLEDRILLREGKKQIYGSQVQRNDADEWEPLPLEDEAGVDARRARVGLQPLAKYLLGFAERSGGKVNPKYLPAPAPKAEAAK